jgi:hypothetical protein
VVLTNRGELEAITGHADKVFASFSSPDDSNVFMIRAVGDLGPEYRPIVDVPELTTSTP